MKSFTSIEQSKVLAKILPIESADMAYIPSAEDDEGNTLYTAEYKSEIVIDEDDKDIINCWSLAALMELMNRNCYNVSLNCHGAEWNVKFDDSEKYKDFTKDYAVDAAFEMIVWLKEKGLI